MSPSRQSEKSLNPKQVIKLFSSTEATNMFCGRKVGSTSNEKMEGGCGPIPFLFKEGWLRLNKNIPFLRGADGWLVISNKIRSATRAYKEAARPFTNHPVCAVKERDLFVNGAATPPLKGG